VSRSEPASRLTGPTAGCRLIGRGSTNQGRRGLACVPLRTLQGIRLRSVPAFSSSADCRRRRAAFKSEGVCGHSSREGTERPRGRRRRRKNVLMCGDVISCGQRDKPNKSGTKNMFPRCNSDPRKRLIVLCRYILDIKSRTRLMNSCGVYFMKEIRSLRLCRNRLYRARMHISQPDSRRSFLTALFRRILVGPPN